MDQHRSGNTAPARRIDEIAQGDVVGNDDDFDRNPVAAREFGGEAEIQAVARIVFDDQHRAGRTAGGSDRGQHRIDAWRGEDVASHRGTQKARPDIARMGGFVAAAAPRYHHDLPVGGGGKIGAQDDVLVP